MKTKGRAAAISFLAVFLAFSAQAPLAHGVWQPGQSAPACRTDGHDSSLTRKAIPETGVRPTSAERQGENFPAELWEKPRDFAQGEGVPREIKEHLEHLLKKWQEGGPDRRDALHH